jgi:hypothetical protein
MKLECYVKEVIHRSGNVPREIYQRVYTVEGIQYSLSFLFGVGYYKEIIDKTIV